jgi:hypothetical protein
VERVLPTFLITEGVEVTVVLIVLAKPLIYDTVPVAANERFFLAPFTNVETEVDVALRALENVKLERTVEVDVALPDTSLPTRLTKVDTLPIEAFTDRLALLTNVVVAVDVASKAW